MSNPEARNRKGCGLSYWVMIFIAAAILLTVALPFLGIGIPSHNAAAIWQKNFPGMDGVAVTLKTARKYRGDVCLEIVCSEETHRALINAKGMKMAEPTAAEDFIKYNYPASRLPSWPTDIGNPEIYVSYPIEGVVDYLFRFQNTTYFVVINCRQ